MIEGLKPLYNAALRPVALLFAKINIHPDAITAMGVAVSLAAGWACAAGLWLVAALLVFAGSCMDGLDGLVARQTGTQTRFGAVLDSAGDRITEAAWCFGLLAFYAWHPVYGLAGILLAFLAQAGSQMVSYVRARAEGAGISCKAGILQRPERIIIILVCLLLGPRVMLWGLGVISALAFVTAGERLFAVYRADRNYRQPS
jgi:CDP-diacylglycerol--glycerol-3-phosphate 3-phosphatidyltransferase